MTPFRRLWLAALLRSLSLWAALVGLVVGVLATHDGSTLAWVLLAANVPALLAGVLGGVTVDRAEPRRVVRATAPLQAIALLGTGLTLGTSLVLATACYAVFLVTLRFAAPAHQKLVYAVVAHADRPRANAALGAANGITAIVGAAAGGLGVALVGVAPAFAVAAALALVTVVLIWAVPPAGVDGGESGSDGASNETGGGWRALRRYPITTGVIWVGIAWGLLGGGYDVLVGVLGTRLPGAGGAGVGLLYVVDGVGVLVGTLLAGRIRRGWWIRAFGAAYLAQGVFWALFAVSPSFAPAAAALFLMRLAGGVIIALDTTLLLDGVPERLHGRAFGLHATTYGAVLRVSLAATGLALGAVSPRVVAVAGGVGSVLVGLAWWLTGARRAARQAAVCVSPP